MTSGLFTHVPWCFWNPGICHLLLDDWTQISCERKKAIFLFDFFLVWLSTFVRAHVPWEVRIIPVTVFVHNHGELWIKSLKAKKLLFCFRLRHWLSKMIAVPMQQSDMETEHFYSQSVPSKQTIEVMSRTMASFASMLWEQKRSVSISDCFTVCPWLWQFQWANQKQKQRFCHCWDVLHVQKLFTNIVVFLFSASQFQQHVTMSFACFSAVTNIYIYNL